VGFFYTVPHWLAGLIIVGGSLIGTVVAYFVAAKFHGSHLNEQDRSVVLAFVPTIATVQSLLLAFSAISVWDGFSTAQAAVLTEANIVGQMARDLGVFNSPESRNSRALLRAYTRSVVDVEWPAMQVGEHSSASWDAFDTLFRSVAKLEPDTVQREVLLHELWARTNELVQVRRERLASADAEIPGTLWAVVVTGSVLTLGLAFYLPLTRFNGIMVAALAMSLGLVLFFLIALDRPFAGRESVSPQPFLGALENMDHWDAATATP
jgi:hypothetical protein